MNVKQAGWLYLAQCERQKLEASACTSTRDELMIMVKCICRFEKLAEKYEKIIVEGEK